MTLTGRRILYCSTNHGWSYGWTFYQMLAQALARENDVVYVDTPASPRSGTLRTSVGTETPRLRVLRTPAVPAQRTEWLRQAAAGFTSRRVASWAGRAGFEPDVVWTYVPYELRTAERFPRARLVYWTGDEVVIPGEDELLERADAILCVSQPVFERHRAAFGERAHRVSVAVEFDRYHGARGSAAPELDHVRRPILGYSGWVNPRLDYTLLVELARELDGTVVLVGPVAGADPSSLAAAERAGVVLLGPQPRDRVPALIANFDVGLLPLVDSEFNRNANPTKFYEYLALGLPVVTTDIPTLRAFDGVASVGARDTFVERVRAALASRDGEAGRIAVARDHSFDALLELLGTLPL